MNNDVLTVLLASSASYETKESFLCGAVMGPHLVPALCVDVCLTQATG